MSLVHLFRQNSRIVKTEFMYFYYSTHYIRKLKKFDGNA